MTRVVVDASVALKWFVPENHHEAALRLLDSNYELLSPDLLTAEFGNVVWKKVRRREMSPREARLMLKLFSAVSIEVVNCARIIEPALELALTTGRTVYDCLYLSLAIVRDCRLVTADRKFFNALTSTFLNDHLLWAEDLP